MNKEELNYLQLLRKIINEGSKREDRTGVGTLSLFGTQLRFSLEDNKIPMLTTKKMFTKGIIEELLFFLRGETDTKLLEEKGVNIWKGNTSREFLNKRGLLHLPEGSMGKGYGFQWRKFNSDVKLYNEYYVPSDPGVDQLAQVIDTLRKDPSDRRMIITAWNPSQLDDMALPPCHMMIQFFVDDNKLSAQFYQRSVDSFLGLPFNILSYAIFTRIIAKTVGMQTKELIFVGGDTHIYLNHLDQVKLQLERTPFEFPTMTINKSLSSVKDIENLQFSDFEISNYQSYSSIKADMAI